MDQLEPRFNMAAGMRWASRVSSIGMEFALPSLFGAWIDHHWRLRPLATVVGALAGFTMGMYHILVIAREKPGS